jgi:1-acyl-sn-glycerol-3-phosphate acyltransferase
MKKKLYKFIFFKLMGWKIAGSIDQNLKQCVLMPMPHTSNHDFYLGVFVRGITGLDMHFVGKKELFKWPFGWFFKYMGGEPIERTGGLNKVEAIAKIFETKEIFRLAIAPEGTRKKVNELKTGFYYIAQKANVPIITVTFDFGRKQIALGKPFFPTGNFDSDIQILLKDFEGSRGKIPENGFHGIA